MYIESPMLHVAAMSFPSYQGTQGVVRAMLEALHLSGKSPHLLSYAPAGYAYRPPFTLHRIGDFPPYRSLRAGLAPAKIALDARMALHLKALVRRISAGVIVAHNVEAAAAAVTARAAPVIFFAHTDMGNELPCYRLGLPARACRVAGGALDGWLARRSAAVATISPLLQRRFSHLLRDRARKKVGCAAPEVRYLPPPWPVPEAVKGAERAEHRRVLGYQPDDAVLLYAGNLDRYQGWETVLDTARILSADRARLRVHFATESDPGPLWSRAGEAGVADRLQVTGLNGEAARRRAHAVADVAVVPRRAAGGLPVKLLEALARGVPTVAAPLAAAGLSLDGAALIAAGLEAEAMADRIRSVLNDRRLRERLSRAGPAYVSSQHSTERFVNELTDLQRCVGSNGMGRA
jgi:glycosyltransferase involved in cell wall biosynthesis